MLTPWKIIIVRYMRAPQTENLESELSGIWPEIHPDDKQSVYEFLYLAKQWKVFFKLFLTDINESANILPWLHFLLILDEAHLPLPLQHTEPLRKGLKRQKIRVKEITSLKETINLLLTKKRYLFLQEVQETKQELLSSAKIAKSEQLYEKQVDYLNQLKQIFPTDNSVKEIISEREKFNAEQALSKIGRIKKKKSAHRATLSEEEQMLIAQIEKQTQKYFDKDASLANDFSIMFRNFGEYNHSIEYINKNDGSHGKDWQLLDLYLIARQHINLLSHCEMMKTKYSNQPNALFSISYAEALGYWELGERNKAIQLMSQIASMKPNFKSANEILTEWKEESIE